MAKSLGIFVSTDDKMDHVMGIVKAAKKKGSNVKVFFSWRATTLAKTSPDFPELCKIADDVSICADSYKNMGYDVDDVPEGLTTEKMATQAQHGELIENFDCYLSL